MIDFVLFDDNLIIVSKITQREGAMDKENIRVENEKQAYEKPELTKHGQLKDVTAERVGSPKSMGGGLLGCTRY